MNTSKIIVTFLLVSLYSCSQKPIKHIPNQRAVAFNDRIVPLVSFISNPDSSRKALSFLDSATVIDSNYFLGYFNKLMFLNQLQQYDKAVIAINNCIRLKPDKYDLYEMGGMFYAKIKDTVASKQYFEKSLTICHIALSTKDTSDLNRFSIISFETIDLIMLNRSGEADEILKREAAKEKDKELKRMLLSYINKTREQLLEQILTDPNGS